MRKKVEVRYKKREYGGERAGQRDRASGDNLNSRGQTQPFDHSLEPHLLPLIESPICR